MIKCSLEVVSTLLPSVMTFNVIAILQPLEQNNLEAFSSDFKFKISDFRFSNPGTLAL